jgi:hypothetical protein
MKDIPVPVQSPNFIQKMLRKIIPSTFDETSRLHVDEQTRLSWAKTIESINAVPQAYKGFFEPFLAAGREFPYTILGPTFEGFMHRANERLICDLGSEIYVLEKSGNTYATHCYPLEKISYVELRSVLLDAYIKISGVTKDGSHASSSIRFNAVTDYLFTPIVEKIRRTTMGPIELAPASKPEQFEHLLRVNYKFMNYGRHSLLAGEKVLHSILQPEIRNPALKLLGITVYRTIFPTHMSILTDGELILIREIARQQGGDRYGGIWNFIPLNKIVSLSLGERGSNLLVLSIHLPEKEHLEYLFQASARQEIDQLLSKFNTLTGK